ncbi:MAG: hypothetical protein HW405_565 [Candidatus Berkelbacteria bacterium]|nr:hypothetical protein [Candidatus Berkelbacteria bacterium]
MEHMTIDSHDGVPLFWPHGENLRWFRSGSFGLSDKDRQAILDHFGIKHWYFRAERLDRTSPEELRGFAEKGISLESLENQELLDLHKRACIEYGIIMIEDRNEDLMKFWGGLATAVSAVIFGRMTTPTPAAKS